MDRYNLITVCTQNYPMDYANKIHKRMSQLSNRIDRHFCITDRPEQLLNWIEPLRPEFEVAGWWNKLFLFGPSMPAGKCIYMDLDIVVMRSFDEVLDETRNRREQVLAVSDALTWMGERFSSSFMIFESQNFEEIYASFVDQYGKGLKDRPGGDQVWIGPQLDSVFYLDEQYPNLKLNLKFQLGKLEPNGNLQVPGSLDHRIRLIDCGGRPKPHELEALEYIKKAWHDVEVTV